MTSERTLAIIKPNAIKNAGKIITMIQEIDSLDLGFVSIIDIKMLTFTKEQATLFYEEHKERNTFQDLVSFMSSGPIIAIVLEGHDIIRRHRNLMISIRAQYADNFMANAIHGSDSVESANREINYIKCLS